MSKVTLRLEEVEEGSRLYERYMSALITYDDASTEEKRFFKWFNTITRARDLFQVYRDWLTQRTILAWVFPAFMAAQALLVVCDDLLPEELLADSRYVEARQEYEKLLAEDPR